MSDRSNETNGPVQRAIHDKLSAAFQPDSLEVVNESYMHSVPPGSETHFKVVVVSDEFSEQTPVARHRAVNRALADELNGGIHALSIEARTPAEWGRIGGRTNDSPKCLGGSKADSAS